jgi:hypothetical protein
MRLHCGPSKLGPSGPARRQRLGARDAVAPAFPKKKRGGSASRAPSLRSTPSMKSYLVRLVVLVVKLFQRRRYYSTRRPVGRPHWPRLQPVPSALSLASSSAALCVLCVSAVNLWGSNQRPATSYQRRARRAGTAAPPLRDEASGAALCGGEKLAICSLYYSSTPEGPSLPRPAA